MKTTIKHGRRSFINFSIVNYEINPRGWQHGQRVVDNPTAAVYRHSSCVMLQQLLCHLVQVVGTIVPHRRPSSSLLDRLDACLWMALRATMNPALRRSRPYTGLTRRPQKDYRVDLHRSFDVRENDAYTSSHWCNNYLGQLCRVDHHHRHTTQYINNTCCRRLLRRRS